MERKATAAESHLGDDRQFALIGDGHPATLVVSSSDFAGVHRVAGHLQADIGRMAGIKPALLKDEMLSDPLVVIGTVGRGGLIDEFIASGKLDTAGLVGRWETFVIEMIDAPAGQVLVIAGSDKRGTIYGMYELSAAIGVSPWYWWADVPVRKQADIMIPAVRHSDGEPKVKYRGIFINDEAPALSGWVEQNYGAFNHQFYDKVFELILRLKGNYLWPAMWEPQAFYDDDSLNAVLANEYGVVIGTTHHEPLMRAHHEWDRYGKGPWNYEVNGERLREFWRKGIERMGKNESIVSIGMRGDGDKPMSEESNIELLEKIVADQRDIIADVTGRPADETPQLWALYKEVQEYYDKGMRVPDDVILLLCDDNWGNLRKLPPLADPKHPGGYGVYYHFDYVGGPRNYKWVNTNQISRVWEQMHLAYEHGVDQIWLVNVGDIKPMELPIQFFLDYAWDPESLPVERLPEYTVNWAAQQFGRKHAPSIADYLDRYTRFNSRRKPELLNLPTYSLHNFNEAQRVVDEYNELASEADSLYRLLPKDIRDAYYQLVLHPILASANLNMMYVLAERNRWYASQGRARTNTLADEVAALFYKDTTFTSYFHHTLANGKWNHMMAQTHIGYTSWQQPEKNVMPEVKRIQLPGVAEMAVALDGSSEMWPACDDEARLPGFDDVARQTHQVEIFNRGKIPFDFSVSVGAAWLEASERSGTVTDQVALKVTCDWDALPTGASESTLEIGGSEGTQIQVKVKAFKPADTTIVEGFIQSNGIVSMEAPHYYGASTFGPPHEWVTIPGLGKTLSGVSLMPNEEFPSLIHVGSTALIYDFSIFTGGKYKVEVFHSPAMDIYDLGELRYGLAFTGDFDGTLVNLLEGSTHRTWQRWVSENICRSVTAVELPTPGKYTLKYWAADPGLVLQKIAIYKDEIPYSYLGPPESPRRPSRFK